MGGASGVSGGLDKIVHDIERIDILLVLVVLAGAWLLLALIRRLLPRLANRFPVRFRNRILQAGPVLRLAVYLLAASEIVPLLIEPSSNTILAALGAAAVALGFAFKDYASSIIAGLVAIFERPYRPGDRIRIGESYGDVVHLGLRSVKIVTPDDNAVVIPHSRLWDSAILNANDGNREILCVADFFLHPAHDAQAVRGKLIDAALSSPYVKLDRPIVTTVSEKPWGTHYRLKAYAIDSRDEVPCISDMTVRGKMALARMGVRPALATAVPPSE